MGEIGDAEVVAPPRGLLGRFTEFGKSDEIISWLEKQDLRSFDAAVVSVDMLAYGGLVAMRENRTDLATAGKRLAFLRELKRRAPKLKIYASSVMMRLAPTGTLANEPYRADLAKWAEISVDEKSKAETAALEKKIPAAALADYKAARVRDLKINLAAIGLVRDRVVEQLILGQDDAKPKGVHVADRERLVAEVDNLKLQAQIGIQPGADELSMLQLARALGDKYQFRPIIKAVYSSEAIKNQIMPYEDRPLHQTVSFQIESVGGREVASENEADILFYVYASRFEKGRAESFAGEIFERAKRWKKYIVADIDPKGDVQGADPNFTRELIRREMFFNYAPAGYAAWNTAGNTVGTALPHGVVFAGSSRNLLNESIARGKAVRAGRKNAPPGETSDQIGKPARIARAQLWFTMNRLADDYVYHSLVRPEALKMIRENKLNSLMLADDGRQRVEAFIRERMKFHLDAELPSRVGKSLPCCFDGDSLSVVCATLENFEIYLPWSRTFEAELDFKFKNCSSIT
jgi:hypothetical protein